MEAIIHTTTDTTHKPQLTCVVTLHGFYNYKYKWCFKILLLSVSEMYFYALQMFFLTLVIVLHERQFHHTNE